MWLLLLVPFLVFAQVIEVKEEIIKKLGVKLYKVKTEEVKGEIRAPAKVSEYAPLVAEVYAPVSGIVKKLFVKEGDKVSKGSPLALIYSPQVADLQTQLRNAKVRLKTAEEVLKREELLYKEEVIPYARYYSAKIEYERAKGEYEALLLALKSLGEVREGGVLIRSPISGYVIEQKVFLGSGVDTSKEMFKIHSHEKLWVYAYLSPQDAERVKKGMKGCALWQERRICGKVDYVSHEVEPETKRVPVRILVDNKEDILRPGLMLEAILEVGRVKGTAVPVDALQELKGSSVVFVRVPKGFEVRKVRVIKRAGSWAVVEGLKEGEEVAISGLVFLKSQVER